MTSFKQLGASVHAWFDTSDASVDTSEAGTIDWFRVLPFVAIHAGCLGVVFVGVSATALWVALALYLLRMFAITGFYHRYFAHRAFKTSRSIQFLFAVAGASAAQRGPLWWAAHHRHHHANSDGDDDLHSPRHGFLRSHMLWFLMAENFATRSHYIRDFEKHAELKFLDRFDMLIPILLCVALYALGETLAVTRPELETNGAQLLIWGFFISTVVLYHATFLVNSLCHRFGQRRYATRDESRNNPLIALLTLGEGWHNNHHHFPGSARQGFFWWELDITWIILKLFSWLGLVRDLAPVPQRLLYARLESRLRP